MPFKFGGGGPTPLFRPENLGLEVMSQAIFGLQCQTLPIPDTFSNSERLSAAGVEASVQKAVRVKTHSMFVKKVSNFAVHP